MKNYYSIKINAKWVVLFRSVSDTSYLFIELYDMTTNKKSSFKIEEKNKLTDLFIENLISMNEIPNYINQHFKIKTFPSQIYNDLKIKDYNIKEISFDEETKLCLKINKNEEEILNIKFRNPNDFIII